MFLVFVTTITPDLEYGETIDFDDLDAAFLFAYEYVMDAQKNGENYKVEVFNKITERTYVLYTPDMFN